MAIPNYESIMAPLLRLLSKRGLLSLGEAVAALADEYGLSVEERAVMLPSGQYPLFRSRVGWAKTYLKQAGLLVQPRRGMMELSELGKDIVKTGPSQIDSSFLSRYESFRDFLSRSGTRSTKTEGRPLASGGNGGSAMQQDQLLPDDSPEELIERSVKTLHEELRVDLLETVKAAAPEFFERLVVQLLIKMGYGGSRQEAGRAVGKSGDGGIDGIINEDRLGLDAIYLQAKRWEGVVGRPEIMKFVGALAGQRATKGVFITTSGYTQEAKDYAASSQYKVVLIDGPRLADLMIEHDLGVSVAASYLLKRIDSDFFVDE